MAAIDRVTVTTPELPGVDLERVQSELGVSGIDLAELDQDPGYYGKRVRAAGQGHITRPNRHVAIYRAWTGGPGLPTDREGLEKLLRWHNAELGILAGQNIIVPPYFSAIVEDGETAPRLYTVTRALTGPDMYDKLTTRPESSRAHTSARRQQPVVKLAEALLGYYTDEQRPEGQPVIAGLRSPSEYAIVRKNIALREGSMPIQLTPDAPERGVDGELWALGNWVNNELRETPDTLNLLEAIARARQQ